MTKNILFRYVRSLQKRRDRTKREDVRTEVIIERHYSSRNDCVSAVLLEPLIHRIHWGTALSYSFPIYHPLTEVIVLDAATLVAQLPVVQTETLHLSSPARTDETPQLQLEIILRFAHAEHVLHHRPVM